MPLPIHTPANLRLQVENGVEPVAINVVTNPRAETNTAGWFADRATLARIADPTISGAWKMRATITDAGGSTPYILSDAFPYTAKMVELRASAEWATATSGDALMALRFLTPGGAEISRRTVGVPRNAGLNTYAIPLGQVPGGTAQVSLIFYPNGLWASGDVLDLTRVLITNVGGTPFFDGDSSITSSYVPKWTGTARASASERHPNVVRNLFRDPMATRGAWPFAPFFEDSRLSITTDPATGRYTIARTAGPTDSGSVRTGITVFLPEVPVTPGTWVRLRLKRHSSSHTIGSGIGFYDADGTSVGTSSFTAFTLVAGDLAYGPAVQVPAGAATARFNVGSTGAAQNAAVSYVLSEIVIATAPINTSLGSIGLVEPVTWSPNLLGPTHSIDVERVALDLGVMSVVVLDANLDPAVSTQLQPGREIRLQALIDGSWENLFVGKLRDADVDYVRRDNIRLATRIALEAVDDVAKLANERQTYGFTLPANLRGILMRTTPWRVNGSVDLPQASAFGVGDAQAVDEQGTALGWLELARDSNRAYVWVDRDGVTNFAQQPFLSTTVAARFTDLDDGTPSAALYGRITAGFSTRDVINTLSIRWLTRNGEEMTETIYGPYRDAASVRKYGPRALTITMTSAGTGAESAPAIAAAILTGMAEPGRQARELTMPVRDSRSMRQATRLDLYDLAGARFGGVLDAGVRITSIRHAIRTDRWTTTYGFDPDGAIARPA